MTNEKKKAGTKKEKPVKIEGDFLEVFKVVKKNKEQKAKEKKDKE